LIKALVDFAFDKFIRGPSRPISNVEVHHGPELRNDIIEEDDEVFFYQMFSIYNSIKKLTLSQGNLFLTNFFNYFVIMQPQSWVLFLANNNAGTWLHVNLVNKWKSYQQKI
jgi:hypothetical protein